MCDYLQLELKRNERVVCQNDAFAVVVPFWAVWPFETLVLTKRHFAAISDLSGAERDALGDILQRITRRYDNLFQTAFPYSMGFHQRPTDGEAYPEWHFHAHYFPPLLRSATVQKFMVGYEMLGSPQRDITPESAAQRLAEAEEKNSVEGGCDRFSESTPSSYLRIRECPRRSVRGRDRSALLPRRARAGRTRPSG